MLSFPETASLFIARLSACKKHVHDGDKNNSNLVLWFRLFNRPCLHCFAQRMIETLQKFCRFLLCASSRLATRPRPNLRSCLCRGRRKCRKNFYGALPPSIRFSTNACLYLPVLTRATELHFMSKTTVANPLTISAIEGLAWIAPSSGNVWKYPKFRMNKDEICMKGAHYPSAVSLTILRFSVALKPWEHQQFVHAFSRFFFSFCNLKIGIWIIELQNVSNFTVLEN